jgi:hypothetical protein
MGTFHHCTVCGRVASYICRAKGHIVECEADGCGKREFNIFFGCAFHPYADGYNQRVNPKNPDALSPKEIKKENKAVQREHEGPRPKLDAIGPKGGYNQQSRKKNLFEKVNGKKLWARGKGSNRQAEFSDGSQEDVENNRTKTHMEPKPSCHSTLDQTSCHDSEAD